MNDCQKKILRAMLSTSKIDIFKWQPQSSRQERETNVKVTMRSWVMRVMPRMCLMSAIAVSVKSFDHFGTTVA